MGIYILFLRRKNEIPFRSENKNSWLKAFEATILGKNAGKNPQPEIKSLRFLNAQLKTMRKLSDGYTGESFQFNRVSLFFFNEWTMKRFYITHSHHIFLRKSVSPQILDLRLQCIFLTICQYCNDSRFYPIAIAMFSKQIK